MNCKFFNLELTMWLEMPHNILFLLSISIFGDLSWLRPFVPFGLQRASRTIRSLVSIKRDNLRSILWEQKGESGEGGCFLAHSPCSCFEADTFILHGEPSDWHHSWRTHPTDFARSSHLSCCWNLSTALKTDLPPYSPLLQFWRASINRFKRSSSRCWPAAKLWMTSSISLNCVSFSHVQPVPMSPFCGILSLIPCCNLSPDCFVRSSVERIPFDCRRSINFWRRSEMLKTWFAETILGKNLMKATCMIWTTKAWSMQSIT